VTPDPPERNFLARTLGGKGGHRIFQQLSSWRCEFSRLRPRPHFALGEGGARRIFQQLSSWRCEFSRLRPRPHFALAFRLQIAVCGLRSAVCGLRSAVELNIRRVSIAIADTAVQGCNAQQHLHKGPLACLFVVWAGPMTVASACRVEVQ